MRSFQTCCKTPVVPQADCSEKALLERVRARDLGWEEARAQLLDLHGASVYRRCLQRLGSIQDAEDAAQETMLRALYGLRGFEGRSGLRTWLFAIADNESFSVARRQQRHRHSELVRSQLRIHEKHQRKLARRDSGQARRVRKTMKRLPSSAREVLALRFFGEASLDEIAGILDIGLSATKMRLYRALDQFATVYTEIQRSDGSSREEEERTRAAS